MNLDDTTIYQDITDIAKLISLAILKATTKTVFKWNTHSKLYLSSLHTMRSLWFDFWCFDATFSNISAISWRPVLVVEEAGVPGENHRPYGQATGKLL